jgi:hypothetical protein
MITTILIVGTAFYWLLYETQWLTINLCQWLEIGACCQWHLPDSAVDKDMKQELLQSWFNTKSVDKIMRCHFDLPDMQPLFGWGYAYQYRNLKPEYKVELIDGTSKVTINSNSQPHLRDAFRVWHNPYIKVKV